MSIRLDLQDTRWMAHSYRHPDCDVLPARECPFRVSRAAPSPAHTRATAFRTRNYRDPLRRRLGYLDRLRDRRRRHAARRARELLVRLPSRAASVPVLTVIIP